MMVYLSFPGLLSKMGWKILSEKEILMLYKQHNFFCIMAASILGLFRLFSIDLMRSIKHSIIYYNVILVQVNPC